MAWRSAEEAAVGTQRLAGRSAEDEEIEGEEDADDVEADELEETEGEEDAADAEADELKWTN